MFWTPENRHRDKPWLAGLPTTSVLLTWRSLKLKQLHFICRQEAVWKQDLVGKRQSNSLLLGAFADQEIAPTSFTIKAAKPWSEILWEIVEPAPLEIFKTKWDKALGYLIQLLSCPWSPDVPLKLNNHFHLYKTTFSSAELQQHPEDKVGVWLALLQALSKKKGSWSKLSDLFCNGHRRTAPQLYDS